MSIKNQVQLITYPDSMGGDLKRLNLLLTKHFSDIFKGGIHVLPPYPSSGDRGFAPLTYFEIEPRFGDWEDVRKIGERFDVLVDVMVNHISRQSPYFKDFIKGGRRSEYADLFITLDKIWPSGEPDEEDIGKIFLRRPLHPFTEIIVEETGETERVWATFGTRDWSEQIDLDVHSPKTKELFQDILAHMSSQGVKILRLDAVAYVIKKAGTSCFFIEPDLYQFLDWMRQAANEDGIEILPEVHAHNSIQNKLAAHGYWVYDFILPALVLHTLFSRSSKRLKEYLKACPRKQFNMLDCHDGIPVLPDVEGVLEVGEARRVVDTCMERGANLSRIFSSDHKSKRGFDAHQINCTYFSALACDQDAYLAARAIQFFSPGVPQVYYVGLLAGENDLQGVEKSGEKRAINRRNYSFDEVEQALEQPVVQRLLKLIRFRNEYEAFNGDFQVLPSGEREVRLAWEKGDKKCTLTVDLAAYRADIEYGDETDLRVYRV